MTRITTKIKEKLFLFLFLTGAFLALSIKDSNAKDFLYSTEQKGQPVSESEIKSLLSVMDKAVLKSVQATGLLGAFSKDCSNGSRSIKHVFLVDQESKVWHYTVNVPVQTSGGIEYTVFISEVIAALQPISGEVIIQISLPHQLRSGKWFQYGRGGFSRLSVSDAGLTWIRTASTLDNGSWWTMPGRAGLQPRCDDAQYLKLSEEAIQNLGRR